MFSATSLIRRNLRKFKLSTPRHVSRRAGEPNAFPRIIQSGGDKFERTFTFNDCNVTVKKCLTSKKSNILSHTFEQARAYFLPNGYPASTAEGYERYAIFQAIAYIFATTSSVLSMQCALYAMGLGENSLPLAATLNWVIKDGFGQLGGVIFAGVVNNQYDSNPKRWRMISTITMEISSGIEILTPMLPGYFLPMASIANIGKNISFLSASASRAAIHNSFALKENLADITAKAGSQTIVASLLGTGLGIIVSSSIGDDYSATLLIFGVCSSMSTLLSYLSLKNVGIHSVSTHLFDYLLYHYRYQLDKSIPSIQEFKYNEFLLGSPPIFHVPLRIGVNVDRAIVTANEVELMESLFQNEKFLLSARTHKSFESWSECFLLMKEGATEMDLRRALVAAHYCREIMHNEIYSSTPCSSFTLSFIELRNVALSRAISTTFRRTHMTFRIDAVKTALEKLNQDVSIVEQHAKRLCEKEWVFSPLLLENNSARITVY